MQELVAAWYGALSVINGAVASPLRDLAYSLGAPIAGVLLFGVIGATSPCQLTTSAGALAYLVRPGRDRRSVAAGALAYLAGKALVYTVLGVCVILAGQQLAEVSIPLVVAARKALGPLMVLLGLALGGWAPFRLGVRWGFFDRTVDATARASAMDAFLLGTALAFAFCPTLFLLFFGITLPLALASPVGVFFPPVFALGTSLPLLGLAGVIALGSQAAVRYLKHVHQVERLLRPVAAIVLVVVGLNDTLMYWFL